MYTFEKFVDENSMPARSEQRKTAHGPSSPSAVRAGASAYWVVLS